MFEVYISEVVEKCLNVHFGDPKRCAFVCPGNYGPIVHKAGS